MVNESLPSRFELIFRLLISIGASFQVNKKMLIKVLRQHDLKGLGAIYLDDIQVKFPERRPTF